MGRCKCCMPNCSSKTELNAKLPDSQKVTFFQFPKDNEMARKWLKFCEIAYPKLKISVGDEKLRICSGHFLATDFELDLRTQLLVDGLLRKKTLKETAVPSVKCAGTVKKKSRRVVQRQEAERKALVEQLIQEHDMQATQTPPTADPSCKPRMKKQEAKRQLKKDKRRPVKRQKTKDRPALVEQLNQDHDMQATHFRQTPTSTANPLVCKPRMKKQEANSHLHTDKRRPVKRQKTEDRPLRLPSEDSLMGDTPHLPTAQMTKSQLRRRLARYELTIARLRNCVTRLINQRPPIVKIIKKEKD